jgi:hypothetical protein
MTDIDEKEVFRQKAIDLINEYRQVRGDRPIQFLAINTPEISAFIRSIQLHEKTKQEFADFKQKVSDALVDYFGEHLVAEDGGDTLASFVIFKPKPDPLVNVAKSLGVHNPAAQHWAGDVRAALDALGFEIREKGQ